VRLEGDAWRAFFDAHEREAFRLETRQVYGVASEQAEYEHFLATGELDIPDSDQWLTRLRHFRRTGRWVGRVHVLRKPLTHYLRYEFAVYEFTVRSGEDVRILDLTDLPDPGLPTQDFWLFDETAVVLMEYDDDGNQLGRELLEHVDPAPYVAWKHLALDNAVPFVSYRMNQDA
jgi:uncharacterized protein DUF6879